MSRFWKLIIFILSLTAFAVWLAVFSTPKNLKVVTCNVGQGDASLIIYKDTEVLIDGGTDNKVLGCLSKYMPFWDRTIELVILTHPQSDHYTGLIGVIERYRVEKILANSLNNSSQTYGLLKNQVLARGIEVVNPVYGMVVRTRMIELDILHPSSEFLAANLSSDNSSTYQYNSTSGVLGASDSNLDTNQFSIVTLLKFGSFKFLFTGDIEGKILDSLGTTLDNLGDKPINYIKIPHHGGKGGISEKTYDLASSGIAVISVGKNSYGHPHEETLKILGEKDIKILRTDIDGDIIIMTDGKRMWSKL